MSGKSEKIRLSVVIGAVILTERSACGLTQQQLAKAAGLHTMAVSKIERGVQLDIGIETLRSIAGALSAAGKPVSASEIVSTAERWQNRLEADGDRGSLSGSALAAAIVLLAAKREALSG
jgi:transcriptional regulator with XRE-family HTH domain